MLYDCLINLYHKHTGENPECITPITGSGSDRTYVRLSACQSLIGVIGPSKRENLAFITESRFFRAKGINVPDVVAVSEDSLSYLQQDLGNTSLYDLLSGHGEDEYMAALCRRTLLGLAGMQFATAGFDWSVCYPISEIDHRSIMWDLNYFKYCFLKPVGAAFEEPALEVDFERLTSLILQAQPRGFMYRDFQSRNVLVLDDEPWFIDYQGARRGPVLYDAVSFLWQARAGFSQSFRQELLAHYVDDIATRAGIDRGIIMSSLDHLVLFRMLQVLGAYGFRGIIERKDTFLNQIPRALATCLGILQSHKDEFPHLHDIVCALIQDKEAPQRHDNALLTVTVTSFSYKKGIPGDDSGNGGGFVFDCRAIHNPGRYEPYRHLTGDDLPVIKFLERESSIADFLAHCYALVDASVEKYLERGFTSLAVSFGCTGGQHRSVYSATHMARHLRDKFGIRVILQHREQDITKILE